MNIFYDLDHKNCIWRKKNDKKNKDENNDERKLTEILELDDETLRRIVNLSIERWLLETR